jgi:chromatin remodeling complex protein RSC6
MVRTTKSTTTPSSETVLSVAPVSVPEETKVKASKSKAKAVPVPVSTTPDVVEPVVSKEKKPRPSKKVIEKVEVSPTSQSDVVVVDAVVDTEPHLVEQSGKFMDNLQKASMLFSSLKAEFRLLEKKWTRELKAAQKQCSRRKRKSGNRAPSGFVKPTRISDELANFLGKDVGTEMARTAVTRDINVYIRSNNLQDAANGRKINPDAKLAALLKLQSTDELTYFNLQRYMSCHFSKNVKVEVAASLPTSV